MEEKNTKSRPQSAKVASRKVAEKDNIVLWRAEQSDNHTHPQFVVCLDNTGYTVSLEKGKLYQVIPDADAAQYDEVRIVDETGEDYLFPTRRFAALDLPPHIEAALTSAS